MDEVVEKLIDVILRWSSVELRRGCGGFSEERWVLPPWLGWGRAREEGLLVSVWREATGREAGVGDVGNRVGAWTRGGVRGAGSLHRRHARRCFSRTVRGRGADNPTKKIT